MKATVCTRPFFYKVAVTVEGCVTKRSEPRELGFLPQLRSSLGCAVSVADSGAIVYGYALTVCLQTRKRIEKLCLSDHRGCDCHQLQ